MKNALRLSTLALALILSGCGEKSTDELIQSATKFQTEKNLSAAIIELKTAIQQDPTNSEARLLLGRIYLQQGNGLGAEKELMRALQNGTAFKNLAIDIAATSYISGKDIDNKLFKSDDPSWKEAKPYVDSFHALYLFDNGEIEQLGQHLTAMAKYTSPADAVALRDALTALLSKDLVQTDVFLKQIEPQHPLYRDSQLLLAKSEMSKGLFAKASETLQNYLQLTPLSNIARLMLSESQIRDDKFDQAAKTLQPIIKQFPEQPFANYIMAVVSYQKSDFVKAKEYAEKALNNGFTTPNVRILAGLSSLNLDLEEQALAHFRAVKTVLHGFPPLNKLYASLELKDGNTEIANEILLKTELSNDDMRLMSATAFDMVRKGDVDAAKKLIAHVEKNVDKNVENLAMLGMLKLNLGDSEESGLEDLKQAVALDPKANDKKFMLALSYLNSGKFTEASAVAEQWTKDNETAGLGYSIKAFSAFLQQDLNAARKLADQAIAAQPDNIQAMMLLSRISFVEKDNEAAEQWLVKTLAIAPNYVPALELNYGLLRKKASEKSAIGYVEKARLNKPDDTDIKLLMASILIDQQNNKAAVELLESIPVSNSGMSDKYWQLKTIALQNSGNLNASFSTAKKWQQARPTSPDAKLALARVEIAKKEFLKALTLIQELVATFPQNQELKGVELLLLAETGNYKAANTLISQLPERAQTTASMLFLRGKIFLAEKKFSEGTNLLEQSYQQSKSAETALLLADLYSRNNSAEKAIQFLDNHFSTEPANANLKNMYANLLISIEPTKAIVSFEELLKEDDENILALNNIAYVLTQANKAAKAEAYAERALKLSPNHPDILDTYAKVMLATGKTKEALEKFALSLKIRPNNPEVMLNYAEALIKDNQTEKARKIVQAATTSDVNLLKKKNSLLELL